MMEEDQVREMALSILIELEKKGTYSADLIRKAQDRCENLTLSQRSFLKRLVEGTLSRKMELDSMITSHLKNPKAPLKTEILCLLRMSIYQIYYMDSVPDYAACNEAVRICKKRHWSSQVGFVNAILRSVCRDKEKGKGTGNLSLTYSMPKMIVDLWEEQLGQERTKELCEAMLEARPVCIRLHAGLSMLEKEEVLDEIKKSGAQLKKGKWAEDCWYLLHCGKVSDLPGFAEGKWMVQDESSQLVSYAAGMIGRKNEAGEYRHVYDLCAAPGGKTMLSAMLLPRADIASFDVSEKKTDLIRSNVKRMNLSNVLVEENDATRIRQDLVGKADLVLCDVPCSGLGVMGRKRDLKYHVTMEKIESLVSLQKKMVLSAASVVKPGGVLLYSTCTIDRKENEEMAQYIEQETGLMPENLEPYLPENLEGIKGNEVQLFPDRHGTDGFYMARFRKPDL